ncbi:MAG: flagellar hook-associated protein FlgK [Bacteroidetes bacterium]|nr:flagellar hook-associated protein FlgK [Bacteroidota bacterium]
MNNLVEISKSGIKLAQKGLSTTAQNITNAQSAGYTRKRLVSVPEQFSSGSGFSGLGVKAADFDYLRDMRTESMIQSKHHQKSYLEQKSLVFSRLETSFVSDTGGDLDARMQNFLQSFASLAGSPSSQTKKAEVVREAQQLIGSIQQLDGAISQQKEMVQEQALEAVGQVNRLMHDIHSLNEPIKQAMQRNQTAFDLMDQQLLKIKELSSYLEVDVTRQENGQVSMHMGGIELMGEFGVNALRTHSNPDGSGLELRFQRSGQLLSVQQGKLGALLELNNEDLFELQEDLDAFVSNIVARVNHEHEQGISTSDTQSRSFFAVDGLSAKSIALNSELVANPELIAVTDPLVNSLNGAIAQNIANITEAKLMDGKGPIEFSIDFISRPGSEVARVNDELALRTTELELLDAQQQQISGVNIDEELSNMIQYQQAYQGAAKVLESAQIMYQTLLSIMQ